MVLYRSITGLILLLFLTGCPSVSSIDGSVAFDDSPAPQKTKKQKQQGPPEHAKAYGYPAQHRYSYYPNVGVYFDLDQSRYFYLDQGDWSVSTKLPSHLRIDIGQQVSLVLETDRPYEQYEEHRKKWPGKSKDKKGKKQQK